MKLGTVETTRIESLAYRGEGIGHIQNKVIFVPFSAPGDLVDVQISEDKRNYLRGHPTHFREQSPQRVVPLCDYFADCGGCHWQHINYPSQLEAKEAILKETLARIGKLNPDAYACLPAIPSPQAYGYRSRVRLQCFTHRKSHIGFFRSQSNEVVPIERCELVSDFVNGILKKLTEFMNSLDFFPRFNEVEILANAKLEEAALSFRTSNALEEDRVREFLKALKVCIPKVYGVLIETVSPDAIRVDTFGNCRLPFRFTFSPPGADPQTVETRIHINSFNQANLEQNENLLRTVYDWVEPSREKTVVDLFCGVGNLSLALAKDVKKVIGLESNPISVEDARLNAELNGLPNCAFHQGDIFSSDLQVLSRDGSVDVLLLDPPRKGAGECLKTIATLRPAKIIYVSCNPTTLARDVTLLTALSYRLRRVQLLDMFPQTYHFECVAEFEASGQT